MELITCPICLDTFNRPKYLPCLHTYCEECLSDYISTTYSKESGGIDCPTCRLFVKIHSESEENLASTFPINHLIMTLLDQQKVEKKETKCNPCAKRGKDEESKYWCFNCNAPLCEACGDFHTALPVLADHKVVPIDETENCAASLSSAHEICEVHPGKKLEMFCRDHDVPCCATCTMVVHRKCETVITLQDAAKDAKTAESADELINKIDKLMSEIKASTEDMNTEYKRLESQCEGQIKEIQEFSTKVQDHVEGLKDKLIENIKEVHEKRSNELKTQKQSIENMLKMVSNFDELLALAESRCSNVQLFLLMQKIQDIKVHIEKKIEEEKERIPKFDAKVVINPCIEKAIQLESIGKLTKTE